MRISVVIPVRNEEHTIIELLNSLKTQTLTPAEIIIADGGSTDRTIEMIEGSDRGPLTIHLIRGEQGFPGRGRNLGTARAVNEWVAFIDAGVKPSRQWLSSLAAVAEKPGVDVVYGSYEPVTNTLFEECAAIAFVPPPVNMGSHSIRTRSTASTIIRRNVWEAVGGFPEDLRSAEDLVFMNRIDEAGFRTAHAPEALVRWSIQPTLWKTFRRFTTYSHYNIRAGLWRSWQARILLRYGLLAILILPVFFVGARWLLVPITYLLLMLSARALIALRRNMTCYPASLPRYLVRFAVIVPILAVIDLAAIAGCIQWLLTDRSLTEKNTSVVQGV